MSEQPQEQTQEPVAPDQVEGVPEQPATPIEPPDEEQEGEELEQAAPDQEGVEPVQPEGVSEKQIEQIFRKFEKSSKVWRDRVAAIMGDDVSVLLACPMCDATIPGYIMPSPDVPDRFPRVREFMGDAQPAAYQQDPNTRTCVTCDGMGEVETGSKVPGQTTLVCTDCGGKGWQGQRPPVVTTGPTTVRAEPEANGQTDVTPQGPEPPEAAKLRAEGYMVVPLTAGRS